MPIDPRHPREIRQDIRNGKLTGITAGLGAGHVQANLAVLPRDCAYDFLLFCQRNPRPCPLIEVTDVGSPEPVGVAPGADLRTDIPRYRIYKDGVMADEVSDVTPYWRDDLVAFLLGCSFTFEWALLEAGIDLWHVKHGKNVAMWPTSIACRPARDRRRPHRHVLAVLDVPQIDAGLEQRPLEREGAAEQERDEVIAPVRRDVAHLVGHHAVLVDAVAGNVGAEIGTRRDPHRLRRADVGHLDERTRPRVALTEEQKVVRAVPRQHREI